MVDSSDNHICQLTNNINLSGLDNLKPAVTVILVIRGPGESCTNSSMDVSIVLQQSFHRRMVEVCAVVDSSDLTGRPSENLGLPRIPGKIVSDPHLPVGKIFSQVTVEVDDCDRSIGLVNTPQQGKCDSMITTERDNTRKSLACSRKAQFVCIRERLAH